MVEIGTSTFASSLFMIAILWIAISYTGSPLVTGVTGGLISAPLVLGVFFGSLVDHAQSKKRIASIATALKAASPFLLLPMLLDGVSGITIALLFLAALVYGISVDLLVPVRAIWGQNFLRKQKYFRGWSIAGLISRTSRLTGYLFSAVLISFSLYYAVYAASAIFIVSLGPILLLGNVTTDGRGKGTGKAILEGFRYLTKSDIVFSVVMISALSGLFLGMTDISSAVLVDRVFHLNSTFLSYIFFSLSAGGIAGSTFTASLKSVDKSGRKLTLIFLLYAADFVFVGLYPCICTLLAAFFIVGFLTGVQSPIITSILFANTERSVMGTVQGAMDTVGTSFNSISAFVAGYFMSITFPGHVFFLMASGLALLSAITFSFRPLRDAGV